MILEVLSAADAANTELQTALADAYAATGDVQVTVSLLYQTASKDYIDFLQANGPRAPGQTTPTRGDDIKTVWLEYNAPFPAEVIEATAIILWHGPLITAEIAATFA